MADVLTVIRGGGGGVERCGKLLSREHWQPDDSTDFCMLDGCIVKFTLLERRHHCRRCGRIYCAGHLKNAMRLDTKADPCPDGLKCKVCDLCFVNGGEGQASYFYTGCGLRSVKEHIENARENGFDLEVNIVDRPTPQYLLSHHIMTPDDVEGQLIVEQNKMVRERAVSASKMLMRRPSNDHWRWSTF